MYLEIRNKYYFGPLVWKHIYLPADHETNLDVHEYGIIDQMTSDRTYTLDISLFLNFCFPTNLPIIPE